MLGFILGQGSARTRWVIVAGTTYFQHKQESICRRLRERLLLARPRWVFFGKSDVVLAELAAAADASADVTYLGADGARRRSLHGRAVLQEGKEDRRLRS